MFVDTVGKAEWYQEKLQKLFPNLKIVVESKADFKYPIVSAASICAKVTRDQVMYQWNHIEKREISCVYGSGYPGDPSTKSWLRGNIDKVFGFPGMDRSACMPVCYAILPPRFALLTGRVTRHCSVLMEAGQRSSQRARRCTLARCRAAI